MASPETSQGAGFSSGSPGATDNDVTTRNNATVEIEASQGAWNDSTGQPPVFNDSVDESDEEFTFPGAETLPKRETPPSPSPQPSKSTLNPAAIPFTFRPAETQKPMEVPPVEEPVQSLEPTAEGDDAGHAADDSDDEEFHFPGAEKLPDPIPAPVTSPSPPELVQVLSPVPENPLPAGPPSLVATSPSIAPENQLSVGPSSLAATSPAITTPPSPDLGPLSQISTSVSTPAQVSPVPVIVSPSPPSPSPPPPARPPKQKPSQAQLEALYAAASSNDLSLLQELFRNACQNENVEEFAFANDAAVRTGLTALHAAASRGYLEIVQWLVEDCGAMPDMEDKEGETAVHKAALNGHLKVIQYLLPERADVHCQDADGWTALHNASSKGYLDVVRWLCELGGASETIDGVPGVDIRSRGGWTPLMNAASKGHLPVVLYLLNKQMANPLVRNNWGETAYDAAAAVFEIWICEVLQKAEAERWRDSPAAYDPLAVHTTLPLIVYEHQRLDIRLKTLAVTGGRPRFVHTGLGRHGKRSPFELRLPKTDPAVGRREVPAWRSHVQLPLRENPWTIPIPGGQDGPWREGAERSHFWLSDWTLDVTQPNVDAEDGWQYANSFEVADEEWVADQPPQLQRLMTGAGAMAFGLSGQSSSRPSGSRSTSVTAQSWVRRRRWVRVMRRRLDIPPLPFLQPDGKVYHFSADGHLAPFVEPSTTNEDGEESGQELSMMPSTGLSSAQDYVARARYHASNSTESPMESITAVEARRAIAKLERATTELRQGILSDEDAERRTQAEVLLNAYGRDLERRRLAAGAQGLLISGNDEEVDYDSESEGSFHYAGADPIESAPSMSSQPSRSTDYFTRSPASSGPTDLTPHLSQAPEFRVPTHEVPQKVVTPRWTPPTPHSIHATWERDEAVRECRECHRRFNFLTRRHCRRCGRIFCDRCSSRRALLDPSDVVHDPALPTPMTHTAASHRVCVSCFEDVNATVPPNIQRTTSLERIVVAQERLSVPSPTRRQQSSSQLSDLAECPVCNENLDDLGPPYMQELHVKQCLEGGAGTSPQSAKYLVYKLPGESTLVGIECVICLEEFKEGSMIARLSCLCSFHNTCLSSWLQRGRNCPVHAR